MILQSPGVSGSNPLDTLTAFVTLMIALSVAAERVTEIIKQWAAQLLAKLSTAGASGSTQLLAILSGILVTALSGKDPIHVPGFAAFELKNPYTWLSWVLSGILVSGGSAFWNHILDILKAAKVQKEQAVNKTLSAAGASEIPA